MRCNNFLKLDNNFLISDFVTLKQGFNLVRHNNVKIKQYKRIAKRRFPLREMSFYFDKNYFKS